MLRRIISACWWLFSLPPSLAHELTHWLVSLPFAQQTAVVYDGTGFVHGVEWGESASKYAVMATGLAPAVLGIALGCIMLWQLYVMSVADRNLAYLALLSIWWGIYVWPGADDLDFSTEPDSPLPDHDIGSVQSARYRLDSDGGTQNGNSQ